VNNFLSISALRYEAFISSRYISKLFIICRKICIYPKRIMIQSFIIFFVAKNEFTRNYVFIIRNIRYLLLKRRFVFIFILFSSSLTAYSHSFVDQKYPFHR